MQGYHHSDGRLWVTVPGKLAILPWFDHWVQPKLLWTFQGLVPSFAFEEMVKSQEERENGWLDSWEVLVIEFQNFFEKTSLSFARGDLMKSMTSWLIPLITSSLRESAMNSRLMNLRTRGMMKLTPMRWTDSTRSWTRWGTSNEKNNWLTTWLKNVTIEMPTRKTSCDVEWPWWKDMVELEKLEKVPDPFVLSDGKKKKKISRLRIDWRRWEANPKPTPTITTLRSCKWPNWSPAPQAWLTIECTTPWRFWRPVHHRRRDV